MTTFAHNMKPTIIEDEIFELEDHGVGSLRGKASKLESY